MAGSYDVIVVGGGIFGVTSALALRARGHTVALLDSGPLPHRLAASTDISKVIRIEYGGDEEYTMLAEHAREGWLRWNVEIFEEPLYHEVGLIKLARTPMAPGTYEYENYASLMRRGHQPERLTREDIARRFPAWNAEVYIDGYFNPKGGYVESGLVVQSLIIRAARGGVEFHVGQTVNAIEEKSGHVTGVRTREGEAFHSASILITTGAWTPVLLPELSTALRPVGQPVFHLVPSNPSLFEPPYFYVFSADSAATGWYGFPVHPRYGIVKIAHHGPGWPVHPDRDERMIPDGYVDRLRTFLTEALPTLAHAPISHMHCCLYCDTLDEHFWITPHPDRQGLTIAAGDSGHAFKFGPILGQLIADAVEGKHNGHLERFSWRTFTAATVGAEPSRHRGAV